MKMTQEQFEMLASQGYNRIPIVLEFLADLETPVSIYLKLANRPYTYLLESVTGGEKWARYSFIGLPCHTVIRIQQGGKITVHHDNQLTEKLTSPDPLHWIEQYQKRLRSPKLKNFPRFSGGLVGYFGYDAIRYIEPRLKNCELSDPLNNPDILLMESNDFIAFDNISNKAYLIAQINPEKESFEAGKKRLKKIIETLHHINITLPTNKKTKKIEFKTNITKSEFKKAVRKAIQYFIDGDAMQMVFSQRLSKPFMAAPINFYRMLRSINPSPYMYFFDLNDFYIAGSSPEILARVEDGKVTVRPLAGTRKRGATEAEDKALEEDLLNDPKEIAEHLMLIDLARNDVGRVCRYGSVKVTEKMIIERYSHVMHISSNVEGELKPNLTAMDVLKATFPAGTLSGTPKIRAMEIIDELEKEKRGIYGGAIGYLSLNGTMDVAIALRTAIIKNQVIHVQAGAGLVYDSVPESEWQESLNKAKALLLAAEKTEQCCY